MRARITEDVAMRRVGAIETPILVQGRDSDELQGIFRVSYDLLKEAGKDCWWESYDHDEHGFDLCAPQRKRRLRSRSNTDQGGEDTIMFFDEHMKKAP